MSPRRLADRCLGLIAAYAVALQSLLAVAAVLPSWPTTVAAEICIGLDGTNGPTQPGHHAALQCCLAGACHSGWAGVPPAPGAALPVRHARPVARAKGPALASADLPAGRPNWPRAPPV